MWSQDGSSNLECTPLPPYVDHHLFFFFFFEQHQHYVDSVNFTDVPLSPGYSCVKSNENMDLSVHFADWHVDLWIRLRIWGPHGRFLSRFARLLPVPNYLLTLKSSHCCHCRLPVHLFGLLSSSCYGWCWWVPGHRDCCDESLYS